MRYGVGMRSALVEGGFKVAARDSDRVRKENYDVDDENTLSYYLLTRLGDCDC